MVLKPLEAQRELLKEIAQGEADLSKKLDQSRKDEFGELAGWFNTFTAKLAGIIGTVRVSAASLTESSVDLSSNMTETAAAVRQIAANIDGIKNQTINQSAGVTETQATVEAIVSNLEKLNSLIESQSSSVVESSASIEQMVANIRSVTQILQKNEASVRDLQQSAENGKDGMDTVSSLVQEILKESDGLLEASSVIQNIASQTNLLAMNAAIEAAHAGESGRGFAVVADEIRKLSEEAAAQGKTITQVMQKLKTAIDTVNGASQNAQKEFEQVFAMTRIVGEQEAVIKGAMDEQSAGGSQVLDAIRQINDITTDVKDGSDNMLLGSREVLREMSRLAQQTDEISNSMNEMSAGINQINSAVNHVNDISSSNTQNIEDLMGEFSRFKGV
jgi:methyl-accepting chemotaxis protein